MSDSRSFIDLPAELQHKILEDTDDNTLRSIKSVSREYNSFFQYLDIVDRKKITKFVNDVANGDLSKVKHALQKHPELLFKKTIVVIDPANRSFKNISGLQYAAWALDTTMLKMMIEIAIKTPAQRQEAFKQLDGFKTEHGEHFDLDDLIKALTDFDNEMAFCNERQRTAIWQKKVGLAQKLLPAHVVFEYCNTKTPFNSKTKFDNKDSAVRDCKGKSVSAKIFNVDGERMSWYSLFENGYAVYKGEEKQALALWDPTLKNNLKLDIEALKRLKEIREAEYFVLVYHLEHPEKQETTTFKTKNKKS